jgi:hypothetical protein
VAYASSATRVKVCTLEIDPIRLHGNDPLQLSVTRGQLHDLRGQPLDQPQQLLIRRGLGHDHTLTHDRTRSTRHAAADIARSITPQVNSYRTWGAQTDLSRSNVRIFRVPC